MRNGDSLPPSNGPEIVKACQAFSEFLETVAALRHPETGCPWDLEQNHRSLARFMIEEAYEASEQMTSDKDRSELCGELGDVLLQVVLNAQVALDDGHFSIVEVIQSINAKMKRRHPHVFGDEKQRSQRDIESIKKSWIDIKAQEKAHTSGDSNFNQNISNQESTSTINPIDLRPREDKIENHEARLFHPPLSQHNSQDHSQDNSSLSATTMTLDHEKGIFQKAKVDKVFPAALKAHKIGEIARRIQFDWSRPAEVLEKLESEIIELRQAFLQSNGSELSPSVLDELGDVYFTLNQLSRHFGTNGETAAEHGNQKFLARFMTLESLAKQRGLKLDQCNPVILEELWQQAKSFLSLP